MTELKSCRLSVQQFKITHKMNTIWGLALITNHPTNMTKRLLLTPSNVVNISSYYFKP